MHRTVFSFAALALFSPFLPALQVLPPYGSTRTLELARQFASVNSTTMR